MFIHKISLNDEGWWHWVHHIKPSDQDFKHKSHACVCVQVPLAVFITSGMW